MVSALNSGKRGLGLRLGWVNVLRSWTKHFTHTVPVSTQEKMCTGKLPGKSDETLGRRGVHLAMD